MARIPALILSALLLLAVLAAPAAAHVTINPREAAPGGFGKFDIRVPNERDETGTVKLILQFPEEQPFANIRVQPVPGFTVVVERADLTTPIQTEDGEMTDYVSTITWEGGPINPGEFQEFPISMGPLPEDADQIVIKAIQTYSDGEEVAWIEESEEGGAEPEHPAPVLQLVDPEAASEPAPDEATVDPAPEPAVTVTEQALATESSSSGLGVAALVIALIALVLSGVGFARGRA